MKNKQKKTRKKTKFHPFILIRNIIILIIIILCIIIFFYLLSANKKNTLPVVPAKPVVTTTNTTSNINDPTVPESISAYKEKQYQILTNLFRYNQNLYISMDGNNTVNIYPDSQNALTMLNNNLTAMASKLNPSDVRSESLFFTDLKTKNDTFINDVIAYNNALTSKNPNSSQVAKLLQAVQSSYKAVNDYMNQNISLFK
ncbi:MAG: hypothetical protein ACRDDL_03820 [Sarcina sp.]